MVQKVVINRCFGGFGLSDEAHHALAARKGVTLYELEESFGSKSYATVPKEEYERLEKEGRKNKDFSLIDGLFWNCCEWGRDDSDLVAVVEELGVEKASGPYAELKVVEVPDGVVWDIYESEGGVEVIHEKHRVWY